jgi:homocysteine S-methyltransferase
MCHSNPIDSLGINKNFNEENFISFAEKCRAEGASILGGCCEVLPSHIKALAEFYKN